MSKSVYFRILAATSAAALMLGPRLAWACSPGDPSIESTVPGEMETHPANAGVAVIGYHLHPVSLSATIDGQPAMVAVDDALSTPGFFVGDYRVMVLRSTPAPEPGQLVHVFGDVCKENQCEPLDLEYVAGAPDHEAPEGPAWVSFDTYDHGYDPTPSCDCAAGGRYALSVRASIVKPEGAMVQHLLGVRPAAGPDAEVTEVQKSWDKWVYGQITWYAPAPAPLQEPFCAVARTVDLAGNESETLEECDVCREQISDDEGCDFICVGGFPCEEPFYACSSILNPGACPESLLRECEYDGTTGGATGDDSTGTTGDGMSSGGETSTTSDPVTTGGAGSDVSGGADATSGTDGSEGSGEDKGGCACDSGGSGSNWAALLGILVLVAPRRRGMNVALRIPEPRVDQVR